MCAEGSGYDYNGYDDELDNWDDDDRHYDDRLNGDGAVQDRGLCVYVDLHALASTSERSSTETVATPKVLYVVRFRPGAPKMQDARNAEQNCRT